VSSSSPLDIKERVRQAVDIVELVERYVRLRRQGRLYVGLCPWHDDTHPSLQVNPERQSFRCWVCDIGGDVFSFVMKMEGVDFREALSLLAERAGIPLSTGPRTASAKGSGGFDKRTLYQALAWAEEQYHQCLLKHPEAEPARDYLRRRGIGAQSIERFRLGFSPLRRGWLLEAAGASGIEPRLLEAAGLLARSSGSAEPFDRFRGRLLFSIRDVQSRPVGFGGRLVPGVALTSQAKYVNSPETPLFTKSQQLYGLDLARQAIRKRGAALVMEGYTDVIMAHQHGFEQAVAVLGTALGENHVRLLKRFADRIVLVLDGDEAGQRRAAEVLELFIAQQVDLRIVTLPAGSDPCDFLASHGAEAFGRLVEQEAVDALQFAFRVATEGIDVETDVQATERALERLLGVIARAPRLGPGTDAQKQAREWKILANLALKFRLPEQTVRSRLRELRQAASRRGSGPGVRREAATRQRPWGRLDTYQRELLELLICCPECLPAAREKLRAKWLAGGPGEEIYGTMCRLADAGEVPDYDRLMLELDDPGLKALLVALDEGGRSKGINPDVFESLLDQLIAAFCRKEAQQQRPAQIGALREGRLDESRATDLLEQIIRQERSRQGISKPTDG